MGLTPRTMHIYGPLIPGPLIPGAPAGESPHTHPYLSPTPPSSPLLPHAWKNLEIFSFGGPAPYS